MKLSQFGGPTAADDPAAGVAADQFVEEVCTVTHAVREMQRRGMKLRSMPRTRGRWHEDCLSRNHCWQPSFLAQGVFEMERSIEVSEQRLLQASVDLRSQMAEIHKLRAAIQLAEVSKQYLTDPRIMGSSPGRERLFHPLKFGNVP